MIKASGSARMDRALAARLAAIMALAMTGCVSSGVIAQDAVALRQAEAAAQPMVDPATLDPRVPTPESIIGHAVADRAVRYDALVDYLRVLAGQSDVVTLTPYATSHEGRTLFYLTITSPANHARLDQIKSDNARLADPRTIAEPEIADRLIAGLPGIAWMAYSIHGDELSSTDAAMQLAYQLAAGTDSATRELREQLVIHIDPLMNPDGRERYLGQLEHLTGRVPNSDYQALQHSGLWSAGRGNHYLFDLNRDWLMQVHPETRGRARELLAWHPHLLVDSHEMGGLDTYLFDPPREPFNIYLPKRLMEWRRQFSADQAAAFDRHGWSYYTQEWYEEWYPGYTNAWANLTGAVGLLYEQAGVDAGQVKQAAGNTLTYHQAVHHHLTSSIANLETLRANRRDIIQSFYNARRQAVSMGGPFDETFLVAPCADPVKLERFCDLLGRQGLEYAFAGAAFEASGVTDVWGETSATRAFEAGTLIVRSNQPQRRLMHAVLGFDPHMSDKFLHDEREDIENHRGSRIYDVTAWNLPMAYGLDAHWAESVGAVDTVPARLATGESAPFDDAPAYGYLIDGASSDVYRALVRMLDAQIKVRVASKPFTIGGHEYQPGSLLIRKHENAVTCGRTLRRLTDGLTLVIRAADTALSEDGPDLGGNRFHLLRQPRVALASQWPISSTSFGSTWHLLDDRLRLRVSPINTQRLARMDLRKYNVLILPNSRGLAGVFGDGGAKRLRTWIEAGGTLIAFGNSAAFVAGKDRGLSKVRLKRDVLDKLDEYAEALKREHQARTITIDPDRVWGTRKAKEETDDDSGDDDGKDGEETDKNADKTGAKKSKSDSDSKLDKDARRRLDQWQRRFSPRGANVAATVDPKHWLCFGVGDKLPVLIFGGSSMMSKYPVATPVRLVGKDKLRLSGLVWPEWRERIENTAYVTVERVGNGQIILFAGDPFFRGYLEGTGRLLLNAILLGPGMGASAPMPW